MCFDCPTATPNPRINGETELLPIPEGELQEVRQFCQNTLSRFPRLNVMSVGQTRLIRVLGKLIYLTPSPLRPLGLRAKTVRVGADGHTVGVRIIEPKGVPRGIVVDIHGGGWTILHPVHDDLLTAPIADAGFVVVSVDYRHAPGTPLQEVITDCEAALSWALSEGTRVYGVSEVFLHGDSSGAHLASASALRCKSSLNFGLLKGMVLFFGCYDLSATPSVRRAPKETLVLYGPTLAAFFGRVTGNKSEAERRDPSFSPLYADLAGLPPALLIVGTEDPMVDDSTLLAERLVQCGVETELVVVPDAPHAFNRFQLALAERLNGYALRWIESRSGRFPTNHQS